MRGLLWWGGVAACGGAEVTSEEASSAGWYATDLHVHSSLGSNDAGEESTVDAIADVAKERGLAMVVITDHSNSAGSMDCPSGDVEDCPNQGPEFPALAIADGSSVQVGVEASPVVALSGGQEARGHIGVPTKAHRLRGRDRSARRSSGGRDRGRLGRWLVSASRGASGRQSSVLGRGLAGVRLEFDGLRCHRSIQRRGSL